MKVVEPSRILEQLEGATVVSSEVIEDEGLHIQFADGRILVVAGMFALSVIPVDTRELH